jgi:EpsD family peptidyl-prolyl cis-trans isomerase
MPRSRAVDARGAPTTKGAGLGFVSVHGFSWRVLPLLACFLCACSGKTSDGASTQIAARVNREEISVHQLNYLLQRQGDLTPDELNTASRRTLEALVDQEVAVQAALEQRLDRDPQVVQALTAARRELLARAYAERLTQGVQAPSATEVKQYYESRSALFAKRRLYSLVDTAVEASPKELAALQAQLPATRNLAEVTRLLRQAGLRFGTRHTTVGPEALPMNVVDQMAQLGEGQSLLVPGGRDAHVFTIVDAKPAALSLDEARPHIESYLMAEQRRRLLDQQIKTLRSGARIEYRGRFAETAALPAAATTPSPATQPLQAVALNDSPASSPDPKPPTTR